MRPICYLALLAAALGCQAAPPPDTTAEAKQAIDAANATWARTDRRRPRGLARPVLHPNAVILPRTCRRSTARSIRAFFAVLNTMSSPPPVLTVRTDSVWASGAMAVDLGRCSSPACRRQTAARRSAVDSGKYIVRWVNDSGRWLMAQDIWNSDVAMPMPPK